MTDLWFEHLEPARYCHLSRQHVRCRVNSWAGHPEQAPAWPVRGFKLPLLPFGRVLFGRFPVCCFFKGKTKGHHSSFGFHIPLRVNPTQLPAIGNYFMATHLRETRAHEGASLNLGIGDPFQVFGSVAKLAVLPQQGSARTWGPKLGPFDTPKATQGVRGGGNLGAWGSQAPGPVVYTVDPG